MHVNSCEYSELCVVPQHQLFGIGMQVDLLVYPRLRWA